MKTILCLSVFLIVLCSAATSSFFPETTSPVLLWSGSNVFTGKSIQYLEKTSSTQIGTFINQLESRNPTTLKIATESAKPEMIVVFVVDSHDFHSHQLSKFEKLITSAETAVIIPYNYHSGDKTSSENFLSTFSKKVIISKQNVDSGVSDRSTQYVATSKLASFLGSEEEKKFIDRSSQTEIIIVYLQGIEDAQNFVQTINDQVSKSTQGNFVGVLFADEKIHHIEETKEAVHYQMAVFKRQAVDDNDDYFPISVWEGIMVVAILIILLVIGVGCTVSVQTPKRFGTKYVCQFTEISDP